MIHSVLWLVANFVDLWFGVMQVVNSRFLDESGETEWKQ